MTNRNKKSHIAKSKILLTILCIFGLAFSYSCSCRDDNPYNPNPTPKTDFTASLDKMNNFTDLVIKSDNTTNTVVIIKFNSKQNIISAEITAIKTKEGETDVGLTTENIKYNLETKELEVGDNGNTAKAIGEKLLNEGDKSTIILTIELTSDTANLNNTTTSVDVEVALIKATKVTVDNLHTLVEKFESLKAGGTLQIDSSSKSDSGIQFKANMDFKDDNSGTMDATKSSFEASINSRLNTDSVLKNSGSIFAKGSKVSKIEKGSKNSIAVATINYVVDSHYEFPENLKNYTISGVLEDANGNVGTWLDPDTKD